MRASAIVASWLEWQSTLTPRRTRWTPLGGSSEVPVDDLPSEWDKGYAQAHADLAETFRLGELSPGGELYESERRWLDGQT